VSSSGNTDRLQRIVDTAPRQPPAGVAESAVPARRARRRRGPLRRLYKRSPRLRRFIRTRKDAAVYQLARFALWTPRQLTLQTALQLADRIGDAAYRTQRTSRDRALDHLQVAFGPALSDTARREIARIAFRNAARCFIEVAKFEALRPSLDAYCTVEGWHHWDEVRAHGRGAIVVTGHIGNWELMAGYFATRGVPIAAIARRINDPRLNQLMIDFRARCGVETIVRESPTAGRDMLRILRARGILAIIIDQDMPAPSVSVPFFGRPARTPIAPAALAVRRNIPVVACFATRRPEGGHRFTISAPVYPPQSGHRRQDVFDLTRRCSNALESHIRQHPAEWVWWHKRWRRSPVPGLDLDSEIQYPSAGLR
jgi:KDO2-lipid IV(A) lauroyltransferase